MRLKVFIFSVMLILPFNVGAFDSVSEKRIDEIVSVFENSTPALQYGYIENLSDGRGYTAGRAGFTTATGDLLEVVQEYLSHKNDAIFSQLLPRLQICSDNHSEDVSGLERLPVAWRSHRYDPVFFKAQDTINDQLYKTPARRHARDLHLSSSLSLLIVYDTIIQHGDGGDPDSFGVIASRVLNPANEEDFLRKFLDVREADLMNPSDSATAIEWRGSVDRVHALRSLVNAHAWQLSRVSSVHVWDEDFAL